MLSPWVPDRAPRVRDDGANTQLPNCPWRRNPPRPRNQPMNKHDPGGPEAKLRYGDNEVTILRQGLFVRCAVTGERITLDELRYWSVDLQEAYRGPVEAGARLGARQERKA
jgi:hypothetical protein